MSRIGDWWRSSNAKPRRHPTDPGRAAVPYPALSRSGRVAFAQCEQYLLREIVEARAWGRQVASRGDTPDTNGWLVMPGRTHSSLMDDSRGMGAMPAVMDSVVQWLADAGAIRPLSEHTRRAIAASNAEERLRDHPEYHPDGDGRRTWDDDVWEVEPIRMLQIYPHLADANDDWSQQARR